MKGNIKTDSKGILKLIHLLAILEGEDVVALDLAASLGEVAAVSLLDGRDVDGHISCNYET